MYRSGSGDEHNGQQRYVGWEYYAAGTKRVDGCGGVLLSNGNIILEGISQEIS